MTHQEEAKRIVEMFRPHCIIQDDPGEELFSAKQCAEIHVKETIKLLTRLGYSKTTPAYKRLTSVLNAIEEM